MIDYKALKRCGILSIAVTLSGKTGLFISYGANGPWKVIRRGEALRNLQRLFKAGMTMIKMSFQDAYAYLRRCLEHAGDDERHDLLATQAETVILDHSPRDHAEAVIMIDTLIENLAAGTRTDQRDIGALTSLQAWLSDAAPRGVAA